MERTWVLRNLKHRQSFYFSDLNDLIDFIMKLNKSDGVIDNNVKEYINV